jgi:hypothetical protein
MMLHRVSLCAALLFGSVLYAQTDASSDVILKAMRDELKHARGLENVNLEKPYFVSYEMDSGKLFVASAALGGLVGSNDTDFKVPRIRVRVGDYKFDNTNYAGGGFTGGSRYSIDRFPLDNLYAVLRRYLWLATDQTYKSAVEAIARKRSALKNMSTEEPLADFARAEASRLVEPIREPKFDREAWLARLRSFSAIFSSFPRVLSSDVDVQAVSGTRYLVTSEGTEVRTAEQMMFLRVRAVGQAPDGTQLRDAVVLHALDYDRMAGEAELAREVRRIAENITSLSAAPVGETYNGPVLFEGAAGAQLFAELLPRNLALTRKPVSEPGRPSAFPVSDLEGRKEARVLPEWMTVTDEPTQTEFRGRPLFGTYKLDLEGIPAKSLVLVDKGVLVSFLLTRQPVQGFAASNGRARLPGAFGANTAAASNLFVRASETVPLPELKKKMLEICKARGDKYGIIIRKLDFPSSAGIDEMRRLMAIDSRDGRGSRPAAMPILIYKLYPDGKEEQVRGMRFRDLNVRALRDIRAAADDSNVFDYLENGAPLALMGMGSYAAETSVIAPSVLVDDMEMRKLDDERPKLPIVPSPLAAEASPSAAAK